METLKQNQQDATFKYILDKAETRGHANHGWLDTYHTFSFSSYQNPERVHFGVLRVLNDDAVAPGMGFGKHPHDNMEIISIPLDGTLEHEDTMGNKGKIKRGEIQVMSAGTGIYHAEMNAEANNWTKFLQIWVIPKTKNVEPRYDQQNIDWETKDKWIQILSPNPSDAGVWIHQDAWFNIGNFNKDVTLDLPLNQPENGVYFFVLNGKFSINGIEIDTRDGIGIWQNQGQNVEVTALSEDAEILTLEVPMNL